MKGSNWSGAPKAAKEPPKVQQIGCGNHHFGCGAKMDVGSAGFNHKVRLCLVCCNTIAAKWAIAFGDLDFLMTAIQAAKAGKCGVEPTQLEVWTLLKSVGIKPIGARKLPPQEAQLPTGDKDATWTPSMLPELEVPKTFTNPTTKSSESAKTP